MAESIKILLIDDDEVICDLVKTIIEKQTTYNLKYIHSGKDIINILKKEEPDLIILDIMLPEKSGYEICQEIRSYPEYSNLPILIFTAIGNPIKALEYGANDFLVKPFSNKILISKIKRLLKEKIHKEEEKESKKIELSSLTEEMDKLRRELEASSVFGLIYIDFAKLEKIEEIYGWKTLDDLLFNFAVLLNEMKSKVFRKEDFVLINRTWSDDFIIFLSPLRNKTELIYSDLLKIKDRIEKYLNENIDRIIKGTLVSNLGFFIGCVLVENNEFIKFERLVYKALKEAMRMSYQFELIRKEELRQLVKDVIRKNEIKILYQPIIDIKTMKAIGYEALSRCSYEPFDKNIELMFNISKQANLDLTLDELCLTKTLNEFDKKDKILFINIEPITFINKKILNKFDEKKIKEISKNTVLEITERTTINDLSKFMNVIEDYKKYGFRIAIDDAGSGFATLLFMVKLLPDFIKLDISLIHDIDKDKSKKNVVNDLINYAHNLNIKVIAEGIETIEELNILKELKVDYLQGFLFAKPSNSFKEFFKLKNNK